MANIVCVPHTQQMTAIKIDPVEAGRQVCMLRHHAAEKYDYG